MKLPTLTLPSFAKINWSLRILGKRPDGFHEVQTVLQTISLHDQIHLELTERNQVSCSCDDPDVPEGAENLVVRAAAALKQQYKIQQGARVQLQKQIPAKAGLGGASSNAAVTLIGLAQLWQIKVERTAVLEIASNIGADVPFFLLGGRALATGTGTSVHSIADYDQKHLIVVTPKASVATAEAYAALDVAALTTNNADFILASSREEANLRDSNPWDSRDDLSNDFESVIFDKEPEIRRAKEALLQAGASSALLAGSGSSVFGVFENQQAQHRAAYKIASEAGWRIFPCVTLSRNEYLRELTSNGIHSYALSTLDNTGA